MPTRFAYYFCVEVCFLRCEIIATVQNVVSQQLLFSGLAAETFGRRRCGCSCWIHVACFQAALAFCSHLQLWIFIERDTIATIETATRRVQHRRHAVITKVREMESSAIVLCKNKKKCPETDSCGRDRSLRSENL